MENARKSLSSKRQIHSLPKDSGSDARISCSPLSWESFRFAVSGLDEVVSPFRGLMRKLVRPVSKIELRIHGGPQ